MDSVGYFMTKYSKTLAPTSCQIHAGISTRPGG